MARGTAGRRPGEFGGVPGLYDNVDQEIVDKVVRAENPDAVDVIRTKAAPHQERMALTQTNPNDETSQPRVGTGGRRQFEAKP